MKLEYILEGLFVKQILDAVEKRLEPINEEGKGKLTLRIISAEHSHPHPGWINPGAGEMWSVAMDFFWAPETDDDEYVRFEVRLGDGSSDQYGSIYLEAQNDYHPESLAVELFFTCRDCETRGEEYAAKLADTMANLFLYPQLNVAEVMDKLLTEIGKPN